MSILLSMVTVVSILTANIGTADTVGNGGDPIRIMFLKGKQHASTVTKRLDMNLLPSNTSTEVRDWLGNNYLKLAEDIYNSEHIWTLDQRPTCAFTSPKPENPIVLSFPTCRTAVVDTLSAAQLLVHESVHHLGVSKESFADEVAIAIYRFWQRLQPGDQGFRYNPRIKKCEDTNGDIGFNPNFLGECGEFMGQDLSRMEIEKTSFRGANLSFVDIISSNMDNSNFRGADLSFSTIRQTSLHGAMFDGADLRHASIYLPYGPRQVRIFFNNADLRGVDMQLRPEISHIDFTNADLRQSKLDFSHNIYSYVFDGADMRESTIRFRSTSAKGSCRETNLSGLKMAGISWCGDYFGAILRDTDLSGQDLQNKDFRFKLQPSPAPQPKLVGAKFDSRTLLPFSHNEALARGMQFITRY